MPKRQRKCKLAKEYLKKFPFTFDLHIYRVVLDDKKDAEREEDNDLDNDEGAGGGGARARDNDDDSSDDNVC